MLQLDIEVENRRIEPFDSSKFSRTRRSGSDPGPRRCGLSRRSRPGGLPWWRLPRQRKPGSSKGSSHVPPEYGRCHLRTGMFDERDRRSPGTGRMGVTPFYLFVSGSEGNGSRICRTHATVAVQFTFWTPAATTAASCVCCNEHSDGVETAPAQHPHGLRSGGPRGDDVVDHEHLARPRNTSLPKPDPAGEIAAPLGGGQAHRVPYAPARDEEGMHEQVRVVARRNVRPRARQDRPRALGRPAHEWAPVRRSSAPGAVHPTGAGVTPPPPRRVRAGRPDPGGRAPSRRPPRASEGPRTGPDSTPALRGRPAAVPAPVDRSVPAHTRDTTRVPRRTAPTAREGQHEVEEGHQHCGSVTSTTDRFEPVRCQPGNTGIAVSPASPGTSRQ